MPEPTHKYQQKEAQARVGKCQGCGLNAAVKPVAEFQRTGAPAKRFWQYVRDLLLCMVCTDAAGRCERPFLAYRRSQRAGGAP